MSIVDWIYPKRCGECGERGEYICLGCASKLVRPTPICPMCCRPSAGGWVHSRCRRRDGMERLVVGLPYRGAVQRCLKRVKYQSQWDRISFLFDLWKKKTGFRIDDLRLKNAVVTSVPMWRTKERERGFNQAEILGKLVAEERGLLYKELLVRTRETRAMYGLKKEERRENVEGAFRVQKQCHGDTVSRILLVDDVWTTGATLREAARMLKRGAMVEVWGLTLGR